MTKRISELPAADPLDGTELVEVSQDQGSAGLVSVQCTAQDIADLTILELPVACSDEATALTAGTAKVTFHWMLTGDVLDIWAGLTTPQTSGSIFTVDVNNNGSTMLSTKITIDNTEETSLTAATARVLTNTAITKGQKCTIDIDQIGDGTAKGLKVYFAVRRS